MRNYYITYTQNGAHIQLHRTTQYTQWGIANRYKCEWKRERTEKKKINGDCWITN